MRIPRICCDDDQSHKLLLSQRHYLWLYNYGDVDGHLFDHCCEVLDFIIKPSVESVKRLCILSARLHIDHSIYQENPRRPLELT